MKAVEELGRDRCLTEGLDRVGERARQLLTVAVGVESDTAPAESFGGVSRLQWMASLEAETFEARANVSGMQWNVDEELNGWSGGD